MTPLPQNFITAVCAEFDISKKQLVHPRRQSQAICDIRFAMWAILKSQTRMTYPQIAGAFNRADNGSIYHGVSRHWKLMQTDQEYKHLAKELLRVFCAVRREGEQDGL